MVADPELYPLGLSVDTSGFLRTPGSDGLRILESSISDPGGLPFGIVPVPNFGWGRHTGTYPALGPQHRLDSLLTMDADRPTGCTTSMTRVFWCASSPQSQSRLYSVRLFSPLPLHSLPSLLNLDCKATGCGVTNQLRDLSTPRDQQALNDWSSACFCLTILCVPVTPVVRLEKCLREDTSI